MLVTQPPYALAPTNFRFAALAALAGRAPIGGQREVALAAYVVARLVHDVVVDRGLTHTARVERASHAKHWLSTLALPPTLRPAFVSSVDASAGERDAAARDAAARAMRDVMATATGFLDPACREELAQLVAALELPDAQPVAK